MNLKTWIMKQSQSYMYKTASLWSATQSTFCLMKKIYRHLKQSSTFSWMMKQLRTQTQPLMDNIMYLAQFHHWTWCKGPPYSLSRFDIILHLDFFYSKSFTHLLTYQDLVVDNLLFNMTDRPDARSRSLREYDEASMWTPIFLVKFVRNQLTRNITGKIAFAKK